MIKVAGTERVAVAVPGLDIAQVTRANFELTTASVSASGVSFVRVRSTDPRSTRVAVQQEEAHRVLAGLRALGRRRPVYVRVHRTDGTAQTFPAHALADDVRDTVMWEVFEYYVDEHGPLTAGRGYSCQVDIWSEDPLRAVRSGSINTSARELPLDLPFDAEAERVLEAADLSEVRFPIDAVYTWVDAADPAWQQRFESHSGLAPAEVIADPRFRSFDELKYSIRSVFQYAPWIRHTYLVTDGQTPDWFDRDGPVTLVDHREILPEQAIPTFNSHALESSLHKIPGLSEHFLYFNDDVLLTRPVSPELFFRSNGVSYFFLSHSCFPPGPSQNGDSPVVGARRKASTLVGDEFGVYPIRNVKHGPIPLQKSLLDELERRWPEDFAATRVSRLRSQDDLVICWLHHHIGYFLRKTMPGKMSYQYLLVGSDDVLDALDAIMGNRDIDCMCLNDSESAVSFDAERRDSIAAVLRRMFPVPSPAEFG